MAIYHLQRKKSINTIIKKKKRRRWMNRTGSTSPQAEETM
jgi:ribosomal protein L23